MAKLWTRRGGLELATVAAALHTVCLIPSCHLQPSKHTNRQCEYHGADSAAEPGDIAQYALHVQGATPQQQPSGGHPFGPPGQQAAHQMGQGQSPATFNMGGMAGALPEYQRQAPSQMPPFDQQQNYPGPSPHFPGQLNTGNYPVHPHQYTTPYQDPGSAQGYGSMQGTHRSHSGGPSPIHSNFPASYLPNHQQQYMQYPGQYGQVPYPTPYSPATHQSYGGRPPQSGYFPGGAMPHPYGQRQYLRPGPAPGKRHCNCGCYLQVLRLTFLPVGSGESSGSSGNSIPSIPRGPPRKPKQSGHALWVGNLPSGTMVGDLKDHFSRAATKDIESVFLISKSNCAFVNYRNEAACAAAMTRFHDSRFGGVRLVCRLRRSSAPVPASSGVPTGPAALMPSVAQNQTAFDSIAQNREVSSRALEKANTESSRTGGTAKIPEKFFIMKSLTVEDMELSVRNNIWATQAHNENALNEAYEVSVGSSCFKELH